MNPHYQRIALGIGLAVSLLLAAPARAQDAKPLPANKDGCWLDTDAKGVAKMPRAALDGQNVPLALDAKCVDTNGDTAVYSVPSATASGNPANLHYQRVWDASKSSSWFELQSAEILFQPGIVAAVANNCSIMPAAFARNCPPQIGTGVRTTCWSCAIVINNCWKYCGNQTTCSAFDSFYPPASGALCPYPWRRYVKGAVFSAEVATDLREINWLDDALTQN